MKLLEALDAKRIILLIGLAGSLAYANSIGGQFVFDDTEQIVANQDIRSWSNLGRAFTTHVWAFRESSNFLRVPVPAPYYRPLFTVMLTLEYRVFGLWPQGWHLVSLLLHIICSVGVYLVLLEFSSNRHAAAIGALLFSVYPIHAESVCWISGMTDPLFGMFFVFSFLSYLKYRKNGGQKMLWLSVFLFALALLSKEPAIGMFLLVFVYELIGGAQQLRATKAKGAERRIAGRALRAAKQSAPFIIVCVLYLVARYLALGALTWKNPHAHVGPFTDTLLTLPFVLVSYAGHLLWPVGLSFAYQTHSITSPYNVEFLMPALILAASGCLLVAFRSKIRWDVWFALALVLIPLLPVLNLKQMGEEYMVWDRYLYLPTMGFCYLIALGLLALPVLVGAKPRVTGAPATVTRPASFAFVILMAVLTVAAAGENQAWADSYSLWSKAATVRPGFWAAHYNAGLAMLDQHRFGDALVALQRAGTLAPREPSVFDALGRAYQGLGDQKNAIAGFEHAIRLDPTFFESLNNLGTVYFNNADYSRAEKCFLAALEAKPSLHDARYNLALVYSRESRYANAAQELESVVQTSPDDAGASYELGLAYLALGRVDDARAALRRSLALAKSEEISDKASDALNKLQSDFRVRRD